MIEYLIVSDELLLDDFHGVDAPSLAQFDHQHFGVRSASNNTN